MEALGFMFDQDDSREEKIIPITMTSDGDSLLERHVQGLKKVVDRVFGKELFSEEELFEKLPLVRWNECKKIPGAFLIYLLTDAERHSEIHLFLHEMVSYWLVPGQQLLILSSRNFTFHLQEKGNRAYYFVELLVHVDNATFLPIIHENLPSLANEIKLGSQSKGYAKHILEMKRLSLGGKPSYIYETIVKAMRRLPKYFEHDIFREIQRFLVQYPEDFREIRDMRHLCRLISSHYLFHKALQRDSAAYPEKRHLYFKFLKTALRYPFGFKKVLGIAIAVNSLREYECFEERHILNAIRRILPNTNVIEDSFHSHRHEESKILTLYIEIDKTKGEEFTLQELIVLRRNLSLELKNSIEYLAPSIFIPRNEEELYRNIIALSQELKYVHDLPQAIISFQEQRNDVLKFNVILLRVLHANSPPLQYLARTLPDEDHFISERVTPIGMIRKKYVKEANVFSLEIESQRFLRKNHSIDLLKARQYVVKTLEKLVGRFRDYNGGFLFKQNEQLQSIKAEIGEEGRQGDIHIENLFYALTPSVMQTLIPPKAGKLLCNLFLKSLEMPLSLPCILNHVFDDECLAVVIKIQNDETKEQLILALKEIQIDPLKMATAEIEADNQYFISFLYLSPSSIHRDLFLQRIQKHLHTWLVCQSKRQMVHLHLPRAMQSLDPRIAGDRTSGIVLRMLYEGLMRINAKQEPEYALAERVEISEDYKIYRFKLKKTVWSNGKAVTAYDFEYAWKKIIDPQCTSFYAFLFFGIKNAEAAKRNEVPLHQVGIRALDPLTLEVELEYPSTYFLSLTAHWTYSPSSRDQDVEQPGWAYQSAETHISNGPFKLKAWKLNDSLELEKNPLYWDAGKVKLNKIGVTVIEDEAISFEMFKRGELDWFGDPLTKIPPRELRQLNADSHSIKGLFWLQLNVENLLFSNKKIRQALSFAINRKELIANALKKDDPPAYGLQEESCMIDDGDKERARQLFAEGIRELKLQKIPPIFFTHSEIPEHEAITKEIGKIWQETFGIEVQYERMLWNSYMDTLTKHKHMIGGMSWYARSDDPVYFLDLLSYRDKKGISRWRNGEFESKLCQAKQSLNLKERTVLIQEAERIVLDELPVIPIVFDKWRYKANPRLKGTILSSVGQIDFREAYLETTD